MRDSKEEEKQIRSISTFLEESMKRIASLLFTIACLTAAGWAGDNPPAEWQQALAQLQARIEQLSVQVQAQSAQLTAQQAEIQRLRNTMAGPVPVLVTAVLADGASPAQTGAPVQGSAVKKGEPASQLEDLRKSLGGFRFSGDFRYRFDIQARSGNATAGPLQNVRSRYRLRLNVDKSIDRRFDFHVQLSTAPFNNGITNDQDMAGTIAKHPFSIAEAYVDFHPNSRLALRGGRMEEVFADGMRFLWDDDVRFNGFQQIVTVPFGSGVLGLNKVEFRAGEYFLSNPNVPVLAASSPFVSAGFPVGKKVRDANLFHPGFILSGNWGDGWKHRFTGDVQLYRNANQILLASVASGFPVLVSNALGVALAGPMTGTGNATATPGGAMYATGHFQVARLAYRLEKAAKIGRREMPAWVDFQASRNVGAGMLRDAFAASANLGAVRNLGDVRFLYQYILKDANSLISQFTDDDLGTGTGVNIAVHALRFDLGLTRFLQWQNLFFIQNARRASDPAAHFFVPVPRGASTTYRYLGQLAFSF